VDVIFPLSTEDQNYFSERKQTFEKIGIKVICSSRNAVRIINNKYNLYSALKRHNLNPPIFCRINDLADFEKTITKIGYPRKPFVAKPSIGKGGSNLFIVSSTQDSLRKDDLKFFKEYNEFILNLKKYVIPKQTLITEYLSGDEYSVDTLSKDGRFYYGIVRKRYSSLGGLALEAEVIKDNEILTLAKRIIERFGLSYINNIQVKKDENGVPKILEINPRIPGTINLSIKAGPDFISDAVKLAIGKTTKRPSKIKYGIRILRFWSGVFIEKQDIDSIIDLRRHYE
jgi:carbamoyl-phosphate synthase large subunit